jgi:hypothetical protein
MEQKAAAHLFVVSDARALAWILRESRLAFGQRRLRTVQDLRPGHRIVLYTTQRCFGKLSKTSRPLVIGEAVLTSAVTILEKPYTLDERTFPLGCTIELVCLAPRSSAPDFLKLVPRLNAFKGSWYLRLRSAPVPLNDHDYRVISDELARTALEPAGVLTEYVSQ